MRHDDNRASSDRVWKSAGVIESVGHTFIVRVRVLRSDALVLSFRRFVCRCPSTTMTYDREMSYEEKSQLIADLNELPEDKLQNVLNIVEAANKRHGASFDTDDDEVELDIEKLDTQTLWDIKRFLEKYQQQKRRSEAQKKRSKQERAARRELAGGDMLEGTIIAQRTHSLGVACDALASQKRARLFAFRLRIMPLF